MNALNNGETRPAHLRIAGDSPTSKQNNDFSSSGTHATGGGENSSSGYRTFSERLQSVLKHRINCPESTPQVASARPRGFARAHGRPVCVAGTVAGAPR